MRVHTGSDLRRNMYDKWDRTRRIEDSLVTNASVSVPPWKGVVGTLGGRGGRVRRPLPTVNSHPPLLFVTRGREGGAVSFVWPDNWHERRKQLTGRSTADRPCHCSSVLNANAHTPILRPFPSHVISAIAAALLKMLHRHYFTATASKKF